MTFRLDVSRVPPQSGYIRFAWLICTQPETAPTLERIVITAMRPPWHDQPKPRPRTPAQAVRQDEDQKKWLSDVECDLSQLVAQNARLR